MKMDYREILHKIGEGYILGVPKTMRVYEAVLTPTFGRYGEEPIYLYRKQPLENVLPNLYTLSELGEPPLEERQGDLGWRQGWREMGLSPNFTWYVHIQ